MTKDTNVNKDNIVVFADTINIHENDNSNHCLECDSIFKSYFTPITRNWINTNFPNIDSITFTSYEEKFDDYYSKLNYSDTLSGFFSPFNIISCKIFDNHLKYFVLDGIGYGNVDENRLIFVFNTDKTTKTTSVKFDFLIGNINVFLVDRYSYAFIIRYFEKFGNSETTVNDRFIILNNGAISLDTTFYMKALNPATLER